MDPDLFIDDFQAGAKKLREGKLKKWIIKTMRSRGLQDVESIRPLLDACLDLGDESEDNLEKSDGAAGSQKPSLSHSGRARPAHHY